MGDRQYYQSLIPEKAAEVSMQQLKIPKAFFRRHYYYLKMADKKGAKSR
jgi:hypothetical protein